MRDINHVFLILFEYQGKIIIQEKYDLSMKSFKIWILI